MTNFILKIKTKYGEEVLTTLGPSSTIVELKQELSKIAGAPVKKLRVFSGFPPAPLDLSVDNNTLQSQNICSGDTLIIERKTVFFDEEKYLAKEIPMNHGIFMKKDVPPDDSCLFTSVAFALMGKVDSNSAVFMRQVVAEEIASDPDTYNEAILGRQNNEYCEWIKQPSSWGGAIELAILSKFYGIEIVVVDSVNGILNRFGEDQTYDYRILLLFNGVHYDPLYLQDNSSPSPKTKFHTSDERILQEAENVAKEAQANRQFTDVDRFTLHCQECDIYLKGQVEAVRHAKETGHTSFGEVDPN